MFILWGSSFSCPYCCLEMDRRGYVISFSILFCLYNRSFTVNITYVKCISLHVWVLDLERNRKIYFVYFFCHYKKEKVSVVNKLLYIDFCSAWVRFKCLIFFISYCWIFIYRFIYLFYLFISSGLWEGANYTAITRLTVVQTPLKGLRQRWTPRGIEFSSEWYRTPLRVSPTPNNGI